MYDTIYANHTNEQMSCLFHSSNCQWELRRLSRRALDVFLLGTAMLTPPYSVCRRGT